MIIRQLFTGHPATPEAYRARLRTLRPLCAVLPVLGAATALFALLGVPRLLGEEQNGSFFSGFYTGTGLFLIVLGARLFFRIGSLLKDGTALRRHFTECTDERNLRISEKAALSAVVALFVILYLILLCAGLFAPVLFVFCLAGILGFAVLYLAFRFYYSRLL